MIKDHINCHYKIINKFMSILLGTWNLMVYYFGKWFGDFPMLEDCYLWNIILLWILGKIPMRVNSINPS